MPVESSPSPRLNFAQAAPPIFRAMAAVEAAISGAGLEAKLLHLVKLRASQLNGCAYCIDMHWKDARAAGETETRLSLLPAWRESPFYTPRERAAFEWTETLTLVADTHASDEVYANVRAEFDEKQVTALTWAIAAINAWNRMNIAFRAAPGAYQPAAH
jgi:AhpD family alkylhydroperoxidase